jgi:hypothetical protein
VLLYYDYVFFKGKDNKQSEKELNENAMKKVISQKESLMFGLFFGFLIMLMMVIVNV